MRIVRRPGAIVLVGALIVAGGIAIARTRGPVVTIAAASLSALEQRVIASGRVRVVTRVQLSTQVAGRVDSVRAVEGHRVKAGELLVQLDDAEARASVSQASAAVTQASGRLEQINKVGAIVTTEASRQAETALARAETELTRAERLAAAGVIASIDLEEARRQVDIARAQKSAADAQRLAATPGGVDSAVARSALVESQARRAAATVRLAQTRLLAPRDGVILSRMVEPGATVQPGAVLIEMAADGETQLAIEPDERNLALIRLGQRARASADAYPKEVFDAEVSYIAPAVDPRRGSIEVRLNVSAPPAFLRPDMTVSVDLGVAAKSGVLTVPTSAVRGSATPTPWVFVVLDGRVDRRDVTIGIRGTGDTEIESGLSPGAEVVLASDVPLVPGQRVRVARRDR